MFGLLGFVSTLFATKEIIKEKTTPPIPKGTRFDWEAYREDIQSGMTTMEQIKKQERGGYWTTKPKPKEWYDLPIDTIVDKKRYEYDKKIYGESLTEIRRKNGLYRRVRG